MIFSESCTTSDRENVRQLETEAASIANNDCVWWVTFRFDDSGAHERRTRPQQTLDDRGLRFPHLYALATSGVQQIQLKMHEWEVEFGYSFGF